MKPFCIKVLLFSAQQYAGPDKLQNFRALSSRNQIIQAKAYFRFKGNQIFFAFEPSSNANGVLIFRERDIAYQKAQHYNAQEARDLLVALYKDCPMFTVLGKVVACVSESESAIQLTLENNQLITVMKAYEIPFALPVFAMSMQQPSQRYHNGRLEIQFATCELFNLLRVEIENCGNTPSQLFANAFSQLQTSGSYHEYQIASFSFYNYEHQQTMTAFVGQHFVRLAVDTDITAYSPFRNCLLCTSARYESGPLYCTQVYYLGTSNLSAAYAAAFASRIAGRLTQDNFFGTITSAKLNDQVLEILALSPGSKSLKLKVSDVKAFRLPSRDEQRFFLLLLRSSYNANGTITNLPHYFQIMRNEDALQIALYLKFSAKIEDNVLRIADYADKSVYKFVTLNPMNSKEIYFSKAVSEDRQLVKVLICEDFPTHYHVNAIECLKTPEKQIFVKAKDRFYFCNAELSASELMLYVNDECGQFTTDHFLGTVVQVESFPQENVTALSILDLKGNTRSIKLKNCKRFPWDTGIAALLINKRAATQEVIENSPSNIQFAAIEIAQRIAMFLKLPIVTRNGALCLVQPATESIQESNTYIYPLQPDFQLRFSYQIKLPLFAPLRIQCDFRISQICMCGKLKLFVTNLPKATKNSFFLRLKNCTKVYGSTSRLDYSEIAIIPQQIMQNFVQYFFQELVCQEEYCNFDIFGMLHHRAVEVRLDFTFTHIAVDCVRANNFLLLGRLVFTESSKYVVDY